MNDTEWTARRGPDREDPAMSETTETSVVWPQEAREAAARAYWRASLGYDWDEDIEPEDRPQLLAEMSPVLAALAPHVEAMLDRARAEALREAAEDLSEPSLDRPVWNWLRARAAGVERGELS